MIVAIVDGGIDYTHEDLAANMWVNLAEKNGTATVDDDGNGYKDDIHGYNFVADIGRLVPHNHGTHVAGVVAAVTNNGKGIAGIAGGNGKANSGVRLMSCQIFVDDDDPYSCLLYTSTISTAMATRWMLSWVPGKSMALVPLPVPRLPDVYKRQ